MFGADPKFSLCGNDRRASTDPGCREPHPLEHRIFDVFELPTRKRSIDSISKIGMSRVGKSLPTFPGYALEFERLE
jgi:hypothetical protein